MRIGTWNVKSRCRAGSLTTVASELAKLVKSTGSTRGQMG
jgi:hypothetical protein